MRISDWSSDVCSSDLRLATPTSDDKRLPAILNGASGFLYYVAVAGITGTRSAAEGEVAAAVARIKQATALPVAVGFGVRTPDQRSEEHTSELQSLMRISYAGFCLKKKHTQTTHKPTP